MNNITYFTVVSLQFLSLYLEYTKSTKLKQRVRNFSHIPPIWILKVDKHHFNRQEINHSAKWH